MWYAIISEDVENSLAQRKVTRPAHLARVRELFDAGRVLVAGPHPGIDAEDPGEAGFSGSLIVAEFDSLEAARAWAHADPYVSGGVYKSTVVKPLKKVFPE